MKDITEEPTMYSTENEQHRFGWWKFILYFVTYLGVQTVLILIAFVLYLNFIEFSNMEQLIDTFLTSYWLLYVDFLGFLITVFIFKSSRKFLKGMFSFAPLKSWRAYVYLVGAFVFMYITQYLLLEVFQLEDASGQVETFGFDRLSLTWVQVTLLFVAMAVVTPIKEEILFRGVLHGFLADKWHFWLGLLISSVIFGVLHIGYPISATIMGIVFVVLYKLTRSLVVPIILHIVWNGFAVISLILYVYGL